MKIIQRNPNPSGAYPPIQEGDFPLPPPGTALWPEELSAADFYSCQGFVHLTVEESEGIPVVTACTPDSAAQAAWQAAQPPAEAPEPSAEEDAAAMLVDHEYRLTLLELGLTEGGEENAV